MQLLNLLAFSIALVGLTSITQVQADDSVPVTIPDPWPSIQCGDARAGWGEDCKKIGEDPANQGNNLLTVDSKGRANLCLNSCCLTAKHKEGSSDIQSQELASWGRDTTAKCLNTNYQQFQSAQQFDVVTQSGGKWRFCYNNNKSTGSCD